nr:hypothetical protein [uncultured Brevundimonas sp.]
MALSAEVVAASDEAAKGRTTAIRAELAIANLSAQVTSLSKQVEALTAAKLSEVKARKAPKKA